MKRHTFNFLCYFAAVAVMLLMLAPEAEARFSELTKRLRVIGLGGPAASSTFQQNQIPEPSRMLLIGSGLVLFALRRRR